MVEDTFQVHDAYLALLRRDSDFCDKIESIEERAKVHPDWAVDLEGKVKRLEAELASSRDMIKDLELRVMGLEENLAKKEEELAHLVENVAHLASEAIYLQGWLECLEMHLEVTEVRATTVEEKAAAATVVMEAA